MALRIELDKRITNELEQMAQVRHVDPADLAKEAIRTYLREEARRAMTAEIVAFKHLHPELLATIPGHFAAVYEGKLVDHDIDQLALLRRIEAAYPGRTVLIRQVQLEVETTINVRSFQAAARVLGYGYSPIRQRN
jgi:hypothetical protein